MKNKYTVPVICGAIIAAALLLLAGLIFYPRMAARSELKKIIRDAGKGTSEVLISDMYLTGFEEEGTGETLFTGNAAQEYADKLCAILKKAGYKEKKDAPGGNWGTRIILTYDSGGRAVLYISKNREIYFSKGITQFYYTVPETDLSELG